MNQEKDSRKVQEAKKGHTHTRTHTHTHTHTHTSWKVVLKQKKYEGTALSKPVKE